MVTFLTWKASDTLYSWPGKWPWEDTGSSPIFYLAGQARRWMTIWGAPAICKSVVCEMDKWAIGDTLNGLFTCLHATIVSGSALTMLPWPRSEGSFSPCLLPWPCWAAQQRGFTVWLMMCEADSRIIIHITAQICTVSVCLIESLDPVKGAREDHTEIPEWFE